MIKRITQLGLFLLIAHTLPASAGQMYRYVTSSGTTVISRSLPPSASQSGYDIINDKTMSLIRHVEPAPSEEEIAAIAAAEAAAVEDKEAQRVTEEERKKQEKMDAAFMDSYHSESDLIRDRDYELAKRDKELLTAHDKQARLKSSLRDLQELAAEQELSGQNISVQVRENIDIVNSNLDKNGLFITRQEADRIDRTDWYAAKLKHLQKILSEIN